MNPVRIVRSFNRRQAKASGPERRHDGHQQITSNPAAHRLAELNLKRAGIEQMMHDAQRVGDQAQMQQLYHSLQYVDAEIASQQQFIAAKNRGRRRLTDIEHEEGWTAQRIILVAFAIAMSLAAIGLVIVAAFRFAD